MVWVYHYVRAIRGNGGTTRAFGTVLNAADATISVIVGSDFVYAARDGI